MFIDLYQLGKIVIQEKLRNQTGNTHETYNETHEAYSWHVWEIDGALMKHTYDRKETQEIKMP